MTAPAQPKTLRVAFIPHALSRYIYLEYCDGSTRRIRRPKGVKAMDRLQDFMESDAPDQTAETFLRLVEAGQWQA